MKSRIWLAGAILAGILGLAAVWGVIVAQPVKPGVPAYGPQRVLTNFHLALIVSPLRRADRLIALTQIRLDDYQQLDGTNRELDALLELDSTLRRAAISVSELPGADQQQMRRALEEVSTSIVESLGDFTLPDPLVMAIEDAVRQRALAILDGDLTVARSQIHSSTDTLLKVPLNAPTPVATLQGHPFPLTGAHASVPCADCHRSGSFDMLSAHACSDCHEDEHEGAFGTACEDCHNTRDWDEAIVVQQAAPSLDNATSAPPLGEEATLEANEDQPAVTTAEPVSGEGGGDEGGGGEDGSEATVEPQQTDEQQQDDHSDEDDHKDDNEHEDKSDDHSDDSDD